MNSALAGADSILPCPCTCYTNHSESLLTHKTVNYRHILLTLAILSLLVFPAHPGRAQEQAQEPAQAPAPEATEPAPEPVVEEAIDPLTVVREQLQEIQESIQTKRSELRESRRQLKKVTDETERQDLEQHITQEEDDLRKLRQSFENIALGGLDLGIFDTGNQDEKFDWQQELQVVLKPLFQQLRQLTEKPRQIERLNSQLAMIGSQIRISQRAVENIGQLLDESLDKSTRERLENVHENWTQRLADLQREREINQLQLQVLQEKGESVLQQIQQAASDFVTGRGLNLVLAIAAFFVVFFLMKGLYAVYLRLSSRSRIRSSTSSTSRRMLAYIYQALTLCLSILAVLTVLYITGDVLLLVLALIVLLVLLLGMRNYLPRYMEETKLLLNIGAVRERERVMYKDLPWMVRSLGMYSKLYNPALDGLVRLPMSEMLHLVSRPYRDDEPWFPTDTGDWVMMANGAIGQVVRQTPEIVQLRTKGTILSYTTSSFLAGEPHNLSEGFGVAVTFGIDYQHQPISTTVIPKVLQQSMEQALQQSDLGKHVENILVEFKEAGASSLDYQIYVTMKGDAAESYFAVSRVIQRICIDTSNEQGWVIPFDQLTLNAGTGFGGLQRS